MARTFFTFLMFEGTAEEAMNLYASVFRGASIKQIERFGPGDPGEEGSVKRAHLSLGELELMFFDSSVKHAFTFTPSMSIFVECEDEGELNTVFERLSEGGEILMPLGEYWFSTKFGWLKDRFGVSWQLNLE
jgi:predicted 3-demethylubiquinone-9 3-methyltransferase (glyoxalase superfamily)